MALNLSHLLQGCKARARVKAAISFCLDRDEHPRNLLLHAGNTGWVFQNQTVHAVTLAVLLLNLLIAGISGSRDDVILCRKVEYPCRQTVRKVPCSVFPDRKQVNEHLQIKSVIDIVQREVRTARLIIDYPHVLLSVLFHQIHAVHDSLHADSDAIFQH